jgi:hypothetical protein
MSFDLNLPVCDEPPLPPPHLDNKAYLEFIEFNLRVAVQNGTIDQLMASRTRPVEEFFVLK